MVEKKESPKSLQAFGEAFTTHMDGGMEQIELAAKAYPDEAPEYFQHKLRPGVPSRVWNNMLRVGRGWLHRDLLFSSSPAAGALSVCPIEVQRKYLKPGATFMVAVGGGDHLQISFDNLQPVQVRQIFEHGKVRDLAAQRAWLEAEKTKVDIARASARTLAAAGEKQVFVRQKKLWVGDMCFTRTQLLEYLKQMGD